MDSRSPQRRGYSHDVNALRGDEVSKPYRIVPGPQRRPGRKVAGTASSWAASIRARLSPHSAAPSTLQAAGPLSPGGRAAGKVEVISAPRVGPTPVLLCRAEQGPGWPSRPASCVCTDWSPTGLRYAAYGPCTKSTPQRALEGGVLTTTVDRTTPFQLHVTAKVTARAQVPMSTGGEIAVTRPEKTAAALHSRRLLPVVSGRVLGVGARHLPGRHHERYHARLFQHAAQPGPSVEAATKAGQVFRCDSRTRCVW